MKGNTSFLLLTLLSLDVLDLTREAPMKNLPVDISTFSRMIQEDYLYVDKTEYIYNLFKDKRRYFFLSRPRRFGKSLLISTLKEFFSGKKELFKDLWIGKQKDIVWQEHPIIHLDLSLADSETSAELKISLNYMLDGIAEKYGIDISKAYSPKTKLKLLVENLALKNKVVVLIDEYDKPILDHIHNPKRANAQRIALKNFYDGFKGLDEYMRAIFITVVSKFSKTSIFSGLNNLYELSNDPEGASLTGYTEAELAFYFEEHIKDYSYTENQKWEKIIDTIRYWYNGYQFSSTSVKVYNPFSIIHFFQRKTFQNYWFESGTPSFLIELLKKHPLKLSGLEKKVFTLGTLGTFRLEKIPMMTLFFQTGYLTIKEYDSEFQVYKLGYPNEEIKQSMAILELCALTDQDRTDIDTVIYQLKYALEHKDVETFIHIIQNLLATIPYNLHLEKEAYYHSLFQLICTLLNIENASEIATSQGKIDLTISAKKYVYILEFKFNKPAQTALQQILDRHYYERYQTSKKEIILLGIGFHFKNKKLCLDWRIDEGQFDRPPRHGLGIEKS